jgi:MFS family permease
MYKALGFEGKTALLVTGIYNVVGPITNFFFIFLISDRFGRRKPLIFGTCAITCCLFIEAAINSKNIDGQDKNLSRAGVAMLFLVSIFFSVSFGPVSWTYMSEVMPMQIRGKGNAFATGIGNWLVNVIFSQASPQGLAKLGWKYYFVFAVFSTSPPPHFEDPVAWLTNADIVVTLPTIFFVFKETKGVSLEDIDLLFGERALGTVPKDLNVEDVHEAADRKEV